MPSLFGTQGRRGFLCEFASDEGQSLVEFGLMVPLLFLLIVNAINFGGYIHAWITVANAARGAATYASLNSLSPGSPSAATSAQVNTLVSNDTASLPGTVNVCINQNASSSSITGTCTFTISAIPPDPEGPPYISMVVDLKYTYSPIVPSFSFPGLGIYSTLPPSVIQRRAMTRETK